jgi:muramidase (phage lysozyme)
MSGEKYLPTGEAKNALLRQQVLDEIASGETTSAPGEGYNVLYGGELFSGNQHPNIRHDLGDGTYTSAAGRYQFLSPTWNEQKNALNLKDFGPANQDAAAWNLASETYRKGTGRELLDDAASGQVDWDVLKPVWSSLDGTTGETPASGTKPQTTQPAPRTTATAPAGSIADLPQFLQAFHKNYEFVPVDYDPFAVLESQSGKK